MDVKKNDTCGEHCISQRVRVLRVVYSLGHRQNMNLITTKTQMLSNIWAESGYLLLYHFNFWTMAGGVD